MNSKKLTKIAAGLLLTAVCATSAVAQQVSNTYRGASRDPFEKRKAVVKAVKVGPKLVEAPPVESRIQAYKDKKAAAMTAQLPAPKPTTAFLINELQVTGIFRTPRGWAAMVEAKPIKLSYVIYPGETFYNGMLVAIEEDRLVVRKEMRWSDGKRETAVEMKTLARPNAVTDALTQKTSATESASNHATGSAVPAPGGDGFNIWKYRDQFGELGKKCPENKTISFKPDGSIVCGQ